VNHMHLHSVRYMPGVNRQLGRSRMSVTNGGVWNLIYKRICVFVTNIATASFRLLDNSANKAGAELGIFSACSKHRERNAMVVLDFTGFNTYTLRTTVHGAGNGGGLHEKGGAVRLHLGA